MNKKHGLMSKKNYNIKQVLILITLVAIHINTISQTNGSSLKHDEYRPTDYGYVLKNATIASSAEGFPEGAGFYGYKCRVTLADYEVIGYMHDGTYYTLENLRGIYNKYHNATGKIGEPKYRPTKLWVSVSFHNGVSDEDMMLNDWGSNLLYADISSTGQKEQVDFKFFVLGSALIRKTNHDSITKCFPNLTKTSQLVIHTANLSQTDVLR